MRFLLTALVCGLLSLPAMAADDWLGRKVFCRPGAAAKVGQTTVPIETIPFPAKVQAVNGDWLWLGRAWVRKQDALSADQALAVISAQIRQTPKIAQLWTCRGAIDREKGDYAAAIKDFTEAIRLDPKQAAAFNNRGNTLSHQDKLDAALADLNEAIRLDPKFAPAYANRAVVRGRLGDNRGAIQDFSQAISLDPKDPTVYENRGTAYGARGDYDRAIDDLTEAIRLDATDAAAYFNRGNAWRAKGNLDRAIKNFDQAIQLDPTDAAALVARGSALASQGKYEAALKDYDESIRLDPKLVAAFNARAWLRATATNDDFRDAVRAIADATQACELTDWKDWTALDTLGAAMAEQGDFEDATSWQMKAIALAADTKAASALDKEAMQTRLELYQVSKPYRDQPAGP